MSQNTIRTRIPKPISSSNQDACLIHIYPPGPNMGRRYTLGKDPLVLGRDMDCEICVADSAVSRRHARIAPAEEGYHTEDLQSTNGTYINDHPVQRALLRDGDYLRIGSSIFRFLSGGNVEAEYHQVIYDLTIRDALTEAFNRRYLEEFLERELVRSSRHNRPLSVVMLDIDRFKVVNDERGHLCGDYTLREMAHRIHTSIRRDELFARYGGEEFTVVLPETDTAGAQHFAERLRRLVADEQFDYEGEQFTVTISLVIATTQGDESMTPEKLLNLADEQLYQAKHNGRNRFEPRPVSNDGEL
ncbi:MAG: GGDEF domain-containing protein [Gemmataceae bacterium]